MGYKLYLVKCFAKGYALGGIGVGAVYGYRRIFRSSTATSPEGTWKQASETEAGLEENPPTVEDDNTLDQGTSGLGANLDEASAPNLLDPDVPGMDDGIETSTSDVKDGSHQGSNTSPTEVNSDGAAGMGDGIEASASDVHAGVGELPAEGGHMQTSALDTDLQRAIRIANAMHRALQVLNDPCVVACTLAVPIIVYGAKLAHGDIQGGMVQSMMTHYALDLGTQPDVQPPAFID